MTECILFLFTQSKPVAPELCFLLVQGKTIIPMYQTDTVSKAYKNNLLKIIPLNLPYTHKKNLQQHKLLMFSKLM